MVSPLDEVSRLSGCLEAFVVVDGVFGATLRTGGGGVKFDEFVVVGPPRRFPEGEGDLWAAADLGGDTDVGVYFLPLPLPGLF